MNKKIQFYYFSGTGNTLLAVQEMIAVFRQAGITVDLSPLEYSTIKEIDQDVTIGIAFPVAIQGTYRFVWDWVNALPRTNNEVFMLDTMMMYSGGIVGPLGKKLRRKGYNTIGAREIIMPPNVLRGSIKEEKDEKKRSQGCDRAVKYAHDLIAGRSRWIRIPLLSDIMSFFSRSRTLWRMYRWSSPFKVDKDKCTQCGICAKICPVGNLTMDVYPVAAKKCELCMRCISYCPPNALSLGKYSKQYKAVELKEILKS